MKGVLKVVVSLTNNKSITYSLADPKEGLTKAEVQAVVKAMMDKRAVSMKDAVLTGMKDAYIQESDRRALA